MLLDLRVKRVLLGLLATLVQLVLLEQSAWQALTVFKVSSLQSHTSMTCSPHTDVSGGYMKTHTHTHSVLTAIFLGQPGLASCP